MAYSERLTSFVKSVLILEGNYIYVHGKIKQQFLV